MRCAAFAAAASCSGVSRRSTASLSNVCNCSNPATNSSREMDPLPSVSRTANSAETDSCSWPTPRRCIMSSVGSISPLLSASMSSNTAFALSIPAEPSAAQKQRPRCPEKTAAQACNTSFGNTADLGRGPGRPTSADPLSSPCPAAPLKPSQRQPPRTTCSELRAATALGHLDDCQPGSEWHARCGCRRRSDLPPKAQHKAAEQASARVASTPGSNPSTLEASGDALGLTTVGLRVLVTVDGQEGGGCRAANLGCLTTPTAWAWFTVLHSACPAQAELQKPLAVAQVSSCHPVFSGVRPPFAPTVITLVYDTFV
eukprot:scaffold68847_cov68-Phaeocystis_antarctica.AAC.2